VRQKTSERMKGRWEDNIKMGHEKMDFEMYAGFSFGISHLL
jgi:hypothetical protein